MSEEMNTTPPVGDAGEETTPEGAMDRFVYHQRRALEEASKALDALIPEGFKTHSAKAQDEFNKGFKVLLDAAISEVEKFSRRAEQAAQQTAEDVQEAVTEVVEEKPRRSSSTGKTKVKVQVD